MDSQLEERIFKMTNIADELWCAGEYAEAIALFNIINRLCDCWGIDEPDELFALADEINTKFRIENAMERGEQLPVAVRNIIKRRQS